MEGLGLIRYPTFLSKKDFPTHCVGPGPVAMFLAGGNRTESGALDFQTSSGNAERWDGVGALPVICISLPDALDQQPQTDVRAGSG